jgi:hypothetical protein
MSATSCPYCGSPLSSTLKFCVSCGRGISPGDQGKLGGRITGPRPVVTKRLDEEPTASSFGPSRKSYSVQRGMRQFMLNVSYGLIVVIVFYVLIRYVVKPQSAEKPPTQPVEQTPLAQPEQPVTKSPAPVAPSKKNAKPAARHRARSALRPSRSAD